MIKKINIFLSMFLFLPLNAGIGHSKEKDKTRTVIVIFDGTTNWNLEDEKGLVSIQEPKIIIEGESETTLRSNEKKMLQTASNGYFIIKVPEGRLANMYMKAIEGGGYSRKIYPVNDIAVLIKKKTTEINIAITSDEHEARIGIEKQK